MNQESSSMDDMTKAPAYRLFDEHAVGLATFFGSFIGGATVVALNHHKLGERHKVLAFIAGGVLATALWMAIVSAMPESFRRNLATPMNLGIAMGARHWAQHYFKSAYEAHLEADGALMRWQGAAIGLGWMITLLAIIFGVFVFLEGSGQLD